MIDPIVEAEKIRSRTNLLIAIIPIIGALIISPIVNNLLNHSNHDKDYRYLYSDIYFSKIQDDILFIPIETIRMGFEQDILRGDAQYSENDLINKLLSPYEVLRLVLTKNKSQNQFKNIPDHYVEKMNTFLDERITKDRKFLSKIESADHIKNFLLALQKTIIQTEKELDRINGLPSDLKTTEFVELQKRVFIESTGLSFVHRNIFIDYITTSEYISHCKEDFDKSIEQ